MFRDPGPPGHHHLNLFRDHRIAATAAAVMYAAAAALFLVVAVSPETVQPIDDGWRDAMVAVETGAVTVVAKVFDVVGGVWVIWPLRVVLTGYLAAVRRWTLFAIWVTTTVLVEIAIGPLKGLYDRPRPPDPLVDTSGPAFPSGHATAGAATAIALVLVLLPPGEHRRAWEVRAAVFAFVMALSRAYLRAHWLTDVVAGALLGSALALTVGAAVQAIRRRRDAPAPLR
jgi:undecaprenyl-diphosphatase